MGRDKNKSLFAIAREKLRDYLFFWLWFKSAKIYGNRLHKTVRLSRSTYLDKAYPGGVKIDEYTYLARGVNVMAHDFCRLKGGETIIGKRCFIGSNAIIMCNVKSWSWRGCNQRCAVKLYSCWKSSKNNKTKYSHRKIRLSNRFL